MRLVRTAALAALAGSLAAGSGLARAGNIPLEEPPKRSAPVSPVSLTKKILLYLPNRLFDLTDVVRLRVRAGPGWAVGARVTRFAPFFIGDYQASWVGMPGPRGRASVPLPVGLDAARGVGFGPVGTGSGSQAPDYGAGEIGALVHVYMLGFDVGFDPVELVDFFAGFAGYDISHDDF
jgi:hypothetical protein